MASLESGYARSSILRRSYVLDDSAIQKLIFWDIASIIVTYFDREHCFLKQMA